MSDDVQQRAAEVIRGVVGPELAERRDDTPRRVASEAAAALAAANLLADPDTARQRRLGEAVEWFEGEYGHLLAQSDVTRSVLNLIRARAGVEQ